MAFIWVLICFLFLYWAMSGRRSRSSMPTNWPVFGMIPGIFRNAHRVHEYLTQLLKETGGTFEIKGPWFANMDTLMTSDPANVHYILSKNFSNYPKGPEFRKMFDILGDGIFNADSELWELHRKTTMSLFHHVKFQELLQKTLWRKVEKGLIPVLEHVAEHGSEIDLQEQFQRFTFDSICALILGYDPESLSTDLPFIPCEKAFNDTEEAILYRHVLPESCWKLLNRLQIGKEKKLSDNWKVFDQFIFHHMSLEKVLEAPQQEEGDFCFLKEFVKACNDKGGLPSKAADKFLRDTALSLMIAGRDTTSATLTWFFWLLTLNPEVETKILEEIKSKMNVKNDGSRTNLRDFCSDEILRKMVYLHGALCEALRLFPPVSLEHKAPVKRDMLPSGHWVNPDSKIILSFYSMGRMESIWGSDCLEFKPERWISERGGIKHEPSYKFPAFNAGPRTCLGRDMSFVQMKIIIMSIIYNYHVQVVEGRPISPSDSIILQMKYGFKVRVSKRNP